MLERIFETPTPSVGLVIGSYGVPAYMHLQLASWKHLYPTIPLLIHDDSSDASDQIADLCKTYGASFYKTEKREGHQEGDLSACIKGLEFGRDNGVDIMVKFSRRWVPLVNFVPTLQQVAYETQYATYSNQCQSCRHRFRTECVAWHVPTYVENGHVDKMKERLRLRFCFQDGIWMELFSQRLAAEAVQRNTCVANVRYRKKETRHHEYLHYGIWDWMSNDCWKRNSQWIWHRSDTPLDYYRLSLIYGLPYTLEAFENPLQ
jgi:hypothetical protein